MLKRKLLKRALPLLLSVSMVLGSMPTTALAAEYDESAVIEEAVLEENEVTDENAGASNDAPETTGGGYMEEAKEGKTSEVNTKQETANVIDDNKAEIVTETDDDAAEIVEAAELNAEAALATEIITKNLKDYVYGSLRYTDDVVTGTYTGEGIFDNFVNETVKSAYNEAVQIKVDGALKNNLKSDLVYKWKKAAADGNYTIDLAAGETPTDAGSYRLEISLNATANVCSAATANIDFKIEQAKLQLAELPTSVKIGETLTSFVEDIKKDYVLLNKETKEQLNKDVFVKSFEVTFVDAVTGEKLSYDANTVFEKNKDYAYTVSAELKDANYKLEETAQIVIGLSGDIETSMEITLPKLNEYTYTGEKIALPTAGTDYTVKVTYQAEGKDGALVKTEITNPTITTEWVDADGIKFDTDEAPINAGSYKLVLTYTDTTGRYAECKESIDVTVNPVSVYVKPSLTTTEYPSGASESDILKNVDYEVLKIADNQAPTGFSKDTFWGVSYNNTDRTQPYEPVFTLQVSELLLDGEDKPIKDADGKVQYSDYVDNNGASLIAGSVDGNMKAKYRVVFSGKKTVYYANGNAASLVNVNDRGTDGSDTNHKVDLSADTISKYAADVTITEAKLVTIDTSAYASDVKTKIYDGKPFYETRKEYKKATVEGGTLTYTWRRAQKVVSTNEEGKEIEEYRLGAEVFAQNDTDVNENKYWGVSPYEAGTYMLVISYYDATGASMAKAAQVGPYVIEKQKVQAEISLAEGASLVSYTGLSISDFKWDCENSVRNVVKPIAGNVLNPAVLGEALEWNARDYDIEYVVEYQDNLSEEWKEATESAFEENRKYRLRAKVDIINSTLSKNYQSYERNKDNEVEYYLSNALNIDVKKMGTTEIAIQVDESKITNKVKKYDGVPFANPKEAVSVVTVKDGQPVTDIALEYKWYDHVVQEYQSEAIDSGEYTLDITFAGNETYKPYDGVVEVTGYEITPRSITVKPVVKETVVAGTTASYSNVVTGYAISDASDILEAERELFDGYNNDATGITLFAINSTTGVIREFDGKTSVLNNVLKGDKTYYAVATGVSFNTILNNLFHFSRNYQVTYDKTELKPVRGNSIVTGSGISVKDFVVELTHTVAPKEGVPYYYQLSVQDANENTVSGNFMVFDVTAPQEYFVNGNRSNSFITSAFAGFVYKNSVKEAGGYVIGENEGAGRFTIAIPITKEDVNSGTQKSFKIRWEDGYVETFMIDCKGVVLEEDLTKAVAPKSLAFNTPVTKMIVGEKQQLDVKVTKTNLDDIICLKYVTADTTVLSVSDTGAVVALSKGTATVEAIPCYTDENGKKQEIAGAKKATVKISVSDVTAPKIKSVTAYDTSAKVTYPAVSDGYRREIYVLEGKNLKNDAFESKISAMKNGDWKTAGFAAKPVYNTDASTVKGAMTDVWVTGLQPGPNKDYTVYVRNVSGIRTLADGTTVAASVAGSVKSFAMMLPQVRELEIAFEDTYYNPITEWYMVPLSEKSVSTITTGWFEEIYTDSAANTGDRKEYVLPLDKESAAKYTQPKLNYYVSKSYDDEIDINDLKNTSWSAATDIAKIDKKGKLTLTGVGIVYVLVVDTVSENYDVLPFIITATADRMEIAKSAKLKVGQKVDLFDLVTYYEGKTKLTGYVDYKSDLAYYGIGTAVELFYGATGDTDGFIIEKKNTYEDILRNDFAGEVTAVKPNATMTVEVSDGDLNQNPVKITFTSSAIDPVKALKTTMVTDRYATISFTYPLLDTDWEWYNTSETESSNQLYFRIQVTDASKRVISDRYYNMFDDFYHELDAKNNVILTTTLGGLTRKSAYTVSVTACYLDQMSKAVSKGIKTTDVPAAYPYEQGGSFDYEYSKLPNSPYMTNDGGITVSVGDSAYLGDYPTLTSNNTYTLIADPDNREAKNRLSDTLTWKSTNTKVASVKANAGTYTATLKTLRKGTTKIEISSKLTKRIIARWTVIVNAVGEASYYFGDLDTTEYEGMDEAEYGEMQLLTLDNPVKATLASGEGMSAKFVAPAYGEYTFDTNLRMRVYRANGASSSLRSSYSQSMKQGETLYFMIPNGDSRSVTATLRATGTIYQTMDMSGITLTEYTTVIFTAPEDNYYFIYRNGSNEPYREIGGMKQGETRTFYLSSGTYTVGKRTLTGTLTTGEAKDVTVPANTTNWYVFTAPEDMEYTFAKTSDNLTMRFYNDITSSSFNSRMKRTFEKGEKVYIAIVNDTEEEVKTDITISAAAEVISAAQPSTITLTDANTEVWAQLKLEDAGKYNIKITATAEEGAIPNLTVRRAQSTSSWGSTIRLEDDYTFSNGQIIYLSFSSDTANTKVTVTVSKITGTTQSLNEDSTEAAINADSYVFTAQTAGEYVFSAEPIKGADDVEIPVYVRAYDAEGTLLFDTLYSYMNRASSTGSCTLAAGQKIYVRYYTEENTTATKTTIKIAKLSAEVFTNTWKGTLKVGETKWLAFKAPTDARYFFTTETKQTTEEGAGSVSGSVPSTGYYRQGEGFEVRLRASNADVEYTITVSPVNPEALTDAEFELKANETKWFRYTAAETGKYKAAFRGDVTVSGYYNLEYLNSFTFSNEILFEAGQTIYYKVENSSEAVQKATLTVAPVTAEVMTLESSQKEKELSDGEYAWYSFKASKPGYYRIEATATAESPTEQENYANAYVDYYASLDNDYKAYDYYLKVVYLAANETVYARVTCDTSADKAKVTTTLTAMNPTDVTPASSPVEMKDETIAKSGGYNWYSINGEGTYELTLSDTTSPFYTIYYAKNGESSFTSTSDSLELALDAEDTYTIAVCANDDAFGYTLTTTKREVKQLSLTESILTSLKGNDELYVSFIVPETGRYAVMLSGLPDDVTANINAVSNNTEYSKSTASYWTFCSNINEKVIFKIDGVNTKNAVDFTIIAEAVTEASVTDLTQDGKATIDVDSVRVGHMSWYAYTAPETGVYVVQSSEKALRVGQCRSLNIDSLNEIDNFKNPEKAGCYYFREGETRYWALWYDQKPSENIEFSISKLETHELTLDGSLEVNTEKVMPKERYRVIFTAPEDGIYSFLCAEEMDGGPDIADYGCVEKYKCNGEYDTDPYMRLYTNYMLQKDEKIIFDAVYMDTALKSYTLSVVKQEIKPIAAEGTAFTLNAGEYQYVSITPETSCNITIDVEAADGIRYTEAGNSLNNLTSDYVFNNGGNASLEAIATATSPAYIGFYAREEGMVKVSYTEDGALETLQIGANYLTVESDKTVSFTATEDGIYRFSDSTTGQEMEMQIGNESYRTRTYLRSGDTVLVKLTAHYYSSRTIVVTKQTMTQMSLDATSNLDFSNGSVYVEFDAERDGMYVLSSDARCSVDVCVYKLREQSSGWDDVTTDRTRCMILDAGKYILEIFDNSGTVTSADYTISYYGKGILAEESDTPTHFTVNNNESVYVRFCLDGWAMQFNIMSDKNIKVEYLPMIGNEEILIGEGTNISTIRYLPERNDIMPCFKITGTQNNTGVDFTYNYAEEAKLLHKGWNYRDIDIDQSNYVGYVDCTFPCEKTGDYKFRFSYVEGDGISKIEIYSASNTDTLLKAIDYSQCETESYRMVYGVDYMIRIYTNQSYNEMYINPMVKVDNINDIPYEYLTDFDGGQTRFIFTAPEDGTYEFYSTYTEDEVDTEATLYDATGDELAYNDDGSGRGVNFSIKYDMSAGQTVWLDTQPLDGEGYGSYYVHIEKYNGENIETNDALSVSKSKTMKK